jgi:hypothetical protein
MTRYTTILFTIGACLFGISTSSLAQAQQESQKPPATKIEAFQTRAGIVLIRGYTTVGSISGRGGSQITVDAREFRDARNPQSQQTGISIVVKESGRLERESTSSIDADEIDSLVAGIDYVAKSTNVITKHKNFEVDYRTKGDFRIVVFNDGQDGISASVDSGRIGRTSSYISLNDLQRLKELILLAKSKL